MAKMLKSKYNSTGERCVNACLSYGELRYVNEDGSLTKIEIPCDKYEEALYDFLERVKEGNTQTVMDPREILKRGSITYNQAKFIASEGRIRGIDIFEIDESIECEHMLGISGCLEYALSIWNGDNKEDALKKAIVRAIKIYGEDFIKELSLDQSIELDDYIKFCRTVNSVSKFANIELFKVTDLYIDSDIYQEDLSIMEKLKKNMSITLGVLGSTLGLVVAQVMTNFGEYISNKAIHIVVTIISMIILGLLFSKISKFISNKYIRKNNETIMEMFNEELERVAYDNLLSQKECKIILKNITRGEISKLLINMKGSVNKKVSCNAVVTQETRFTLDARKSIVLPSEYDIKLILDKLISTYRDKLDKDYNVKNI